MATFSGSAGVVKAGGNAIAEITSFSVEQTASVDARFDDTDTAQTAMSIGSSLAFLFQPEGSGSGAYQLSGTGIVTGISQSQAHDGLVERSFSVQGTGALTIGTV